VRINIYSQELILDGDRPLELITQEADTNVVYSGVRIYLKSPEALHDRPGDDDRSAITFWLPKSQRNRFELEALFDAMSAMVSEAPPETGLD
jgi:hypothetical protein